ncbi:radical SAM family heme chaperone HemW [Mucilaginibacter arboris]|uniref:Heme chaperone HemW n=1 Tax=Mucilaginibacter arboris TaxID=2682090 RepID=A0A7K1SSR6_9SPHI|nr:radical SAM family heme chaperone HemW [Mucilaginibacter arboris]MVN20297.1 radical SAM family heme chaperone HemW [Mucilaginibacter arboris]
MAGIYIHIPFCKKACHYCDFHFSTSFQYKKEILQALQQEIKMQKDYLQGEVIETIYFGGGTPSVLEASEINALLDAVFTNFSVKADAEITLEANPDDLDQQKIFNLKQTLINRFSIGVQSFFEEDLIWMNRAHNHVEAFTSIKTAQNAGFNNITIDLIYGYPLLTNTKWQYNLEQFFLLQIPHLSAYSMTVEPQTALASFISKKKQPEMNDEQSAAQFEFLMDQAEKQGFQHYEISNFSLPGWHSRHNSNYWKGVKYLGIGPSAHSFNGETRQWNVANNHQYLTALQQNQIPFTLEVLSAQDSVNEYIMTSLRTKKGLNLDHANLFDNTASIAILKEARRFVSKNWLQQTNQLLTLTREGKLYADHIAAQLFV